METLDAHSAGSPTDEPLRWTDLKPLQPAHHMLERGFESRGSKAGASLDRAAFRRRSLRLLSQVERAWSRVLLDGPETALRTVEPTQTQTASPRASPTRPTKSAAPAPIPSVPSKDRITRHNRVNGQWNDVLDPNGVG
jgi:hypothetical protein